MSHVYGVIDSVWPLVKSDASSKFLDQVMVLRDKGCNLLFLDRLKGF